ncbi:hypothetical protein CDIK_1322 [Cucumispora dikerogammari]|nr:hypothetical protein CDIK_1322 [Cucumispora dikerogammari]
MQFNNQDNTPFCFICASFVSKQTLLLCKCNGTYKRMHLSCFEDVVNEKITDLSPDPTSPENIKTLTTHFTEKHKCNRCGSKINVDNFLNDFAPKQIILEASFYVTVFLFTFGSEICKFLWSPFQSFFLVVKIPERIELLLLYVVDSLIRIFYLKEYKTDVLINFMYYLAIGGFRKYYFFVYFTIKYLSKWHRSLLIFCINLYRREGVEKHNIFGLTWKLKKLYIEKAYVLYIVPMFISLYLLYSFNDTFNIFTIWTVYLVYLAVFGLIKYLGFRNRYYGYYFSNNFNPNMNDSFYYLQ